jgi:transposase
MTASGNRCRLTATAEDRLLLERLSRSPNRSEADRARAILWSLAGQTGESIGRLIGMRPDSVRRLRRLFASGGVEILRARRRKTRSGAKGALALACARALQCEARSERWTLSKLKAEIARRTGVLISESRLSVLLRGGKEGLGEGPAARRGYRLKSSPARFGRTAPLVAQGKRETDVVNPM